MSIEFKCNHCGTTVRAPDEGAGKRGKCPSCHQSVYIPTPSDQIEPLEIAPIDDQEERERERLDQEAKELQRALLNETEPPPATAAQPAPASDDNAMPPMDVELAVILFAQSMATGDLEQAEQFAIAAKRDMPKTNEVVQRILSDEIPPDEIKDIPRPVLVGFFKQLTAK